MVSPDNNNNTRPVWFVSGGREWHQFTNFWQHTDRCEHRDVIRQMQPDDRIAIKADEFRNYGADDQGQLVLSVGIYARGKIVRAAGHFVYVEWSERATARWNAPPLVNCRVDTITARFPEDDCIWKMEPSDDAARDFITESFSLGLEPAHTYTIDNIIAEGCFLERAQLETMPASPNQAKPDSARPAGHRQNLARQKACLRPDRTQRRFQSQAVAVSPQPVL